MIRGWSWRTPGETLSQMPTLSYDALVIGGGLAGASAAFALHRRGLKVLLCEGEAGLARKASGNSCGLVIPYVTDRPSVFERTYSRGFAFTRNLLMSELSSANLFSESGAIQLPSTRRLARLLAGEDSLFEGQGVRRVCAAEASALAGTKIEKDAFYLPLAGYVDPRMLVSTLAHPGVDVMSRTTVSELRRQANSWIALAQSSGPIESAIVVICGAYESRALPCAAMLPLEPVRGQTLLVEQTEESARLKTLICFDGYVTPASKGQHLVGTHYRHNDPSSEPIVQDSEDILERCRNWAPALFSADAAPSSTRVCFRTSTVDRLPYVGMLPDFFGMSRAAASYQPGTDVGSKVPLAPLPGLYISVGHGSRGLVSCPMAGEIIARLATHEPLGDLAEVASILNPARLSSRILTAIRG